MAEEIEQPKRAHQRTTTGVVRSISGDKTISVTVENLVKHPRYGKYIRRRSKISVHDSEGTAGVGDTVEIAPCRRLSKSKAWRLIRVVRQAAIRD